LYIFIQKKWPKVKDLGENLPLCLGRAAMTSPEFWSMGGGRPRGPPIAGSATDCRTPSQCTKLSTTSVTTAYYHPMQDNQNKTSIVGEILTPFTEG